MQILQTVSPESGFRMTANWSNIGKKTITSYFGYITSSLIFFDVFVFLLSGLVTGPNLMSISWQVLELWQVYEILNRNSEIENTLAWVLPNIWGLERVGNTKFGMNVLNKHLLNAAKCTCYSFDHFWVIKRKLRAGRGKTASQD